MAGQNATANFDFDARRSYVGEDLGGDDDDAVGAAVDEEGHLIIHHVEHK